MDALAWLPKLLGAKQGVTGAHALRSTSRKPASAPARAAPTPSPPRTPAPKATPAAPSARPMNSSRPPAAVPKHGSRMWIGIGGGVGGALILLGAVAFYLTRSAPAATWRVPARGWTA